MPGIRSAKFTVAPEPQSVVPANEPGVPVYRATAIVPLVTFVNLNCSAELRAVNLYHTSSLIPVALQEVAASVDWVAITVVPFVVAAQLKSEFTVSETALTALSFAGGGGNVFKQTETEVAVASE